MKTKEKKFLSQVALAVFVTFSGVTAEASGESLPDVSTVGYYFIKNIQDKRLARITLHKNYGY